MVDPVLDSFSGVHDAKLKLVSEDDDKALLYALIERTDPKEPKQVPWALA